MEYCEALHNVSILSLKSNKNMCAKTSNVSLQQLLITCGSFRVNWTNLAKSSHVTILSDFVPKIHICSCTWEIKNCQVLGHNSHSFRSYNPFEIWNLTFFGALETRCSPFNLLYMFKIDVLIHNMTAETWWLYPYMSRRSPNVSTLTCRTSLGAFWPAAVPHIDNKWRFLLHCS